MALAQNRQHYGRTTIARSGLICEKSPIKSGLFWKKRPDNVGSLLIDDFLSVEPIGSHTSSSHSAHTFSSPMVVGYDTHTYAHAHTHTHTYTYTYTRTHTPYKTEPSEQTDSSHPAGRPSSCNKSVISGSFPSSLDSYVTSVCAYASSSAATTSGPAWFFIA